MIDIVTLLLKAGDGGHGRVSFRREKYIPKGGPDGGRGGAGGNIILRASRHLTALQHLVGVKKFIAEAGQRGGKKRMFGRDGEDTILEVPVGTVVWLLAENQTSRRRRQRHPDGQPFNKKELSFELYQLIKETEPIPEREPEPFQALVDAPQFQDLLESRQLPNIRDLKNKDLAALKRVQLVELSEDGQEVVIVQGGFGGRGNEAFKGPELTTPLLAEYGTVAEERIVLLELKLLADIGLVGFPNAGKSTLLSRLTPATPKIAAYPFTTLEPALGVLTQAKSGNKDMQQLVLADIPGLIAGASQGKGLGYDFLRHVEACRGLLFVLSLDETVVFDEQLTDQQRAEQLQQQYLALRAELAEYSSLLLEKKFLIGINKMDLYPEILKARLADQFAALNVPVLFFSAATQDGLVELREHLFGMAS